MVQSSPWLDLAIQRAQRNLMKRRYLAATRYKLTLYYRCSLEARENESKEARAHDPGGPYTGGKLRVDLWGQKAVCDWKGSTQLQSVERTPSRKPVDAFPCSVSPWRLRGSPALSAGPPLPARQPFSYLQPQLFTRMSSSAHSLGPSPPRHGSPVFGRQSTLSPFQTLQSGVFGVTRYKRVPRLAQSAQSCARLLDSYPEGITKYNEELRCLNTSY